MKYLTTLLYITLLFSCQHGRRQNHEPYSKEAVEEEQTTTSKHRIEGAELAEKEDVYIPDGYETVKFKKGNTRTDSEAEELYLLIQQGHQMC